MISVISWGRLRPIEPSLQTAIVRHESALGRWEMALRDPHPSLRPYVRRYAGWFEHMAAPLCRRELPTDEVPVIVSFGAPIRIYDGDSDRFSVRESFATGAYDTYVRVASDGPSGGVQVNFSILGARLFLDRPLDALRNRSVPLEDVLGPLAVRLTAMLQDAPDWDARFGILDREIARRLQSARVLPAPQVCWTWRRIVETQGRIDIGRIVEEVGWSQRHLITRFRSDIGLSPKTMARVMRFGRAAQLLRLAARPDLSTIALDCGYYDQSHFTRDFRVFAGVTPGELLASVLPDNGGIIASE